MLKKLILATLGLTSGLALSVPAFADNGYHRGHYKPRVVVQERVVVQRPAVVQYYRPAPRPVYVVHPAPQPRPVYVVRHPDPAVPLIFGAILGAAVAHAVIAH